MLIRFTRHARERMSERQLTQAFILRALSVPDTVEVSNKSSIRFIAKKLYRVSKSKTHLLLIIYEKRNHEILIITLIDTSKIDKYS